MTEKILILSLIVLFIDQLLQKWQIWPIVASWHDWLIKAIDCTLCRSFWLSALVLKASYFVGYVSLSWEIIVLLPCVAGLKMVFGTFVDP